MKPRAGLAGLFVLAGAGWASAQPSEDPAAIPEAPLPEQLDAPTTPAPTVDVAPGGEDADDASKGPGEGGGPSEVVDPEYQTTEWRQREERFTAHWTLLRLPEMGARLALSPLLPLAVWVEDERVDRRVYDALTNDEKTSLFLPTFTALQRDGVSVGFRYSHSDLFGGGESFNASATLRQNLDYSVGTGMSNRFESIDRSFGVGASYKLDQNKQFFGFGNDTENSDARLLEQRQARVALKHDLIPKSKKKFPLKAKADVAYRWVALRPTDNLGDNLGLGAPGDTITPPPDFDEDVSYVEGETKLSLDFRDSGGMTTRGVLLKLKLNATGAVSGQSLSSGGALGTAAFFVPLAPNHRVLVLAVSTGVVRPLASGDEIPLHNYITVGGATRVRAYGKDRFRDRNAIWGTAEYRYPVIDYAGGKMVASAVVFFDLGRVGRDYGDLFEGPLRRSTGFGLRAATSSAMVFRFQMAFSPESTRMVFSLNQPF